jgi:hypothetical protein
LSFIRSFDISKFSIVFPSSAVCPILIHLFYKVVMKILSLPGRLKFLKNHILVVSQKVDFQMEPELYMENPLIFDIKMIYFFMISNNSWIH